MQNRPEKPETEEYEINKDAALKCGVRYEKSHSGADSGSYALCLANIRR